MTASPLNSASRLLNWSNVLYVGGAALTLATAMYVLYEDRSIATGKRVKFWVLSEFATVLAAIVALFGTIGAIHFGNTVSHLKDIDLANYETAADVQIAQAKKDAATANQKAEEANSETQKTAQDNLQLRGEVAKHETAEEEANATLAKQNQKLNEFTQGLAQQQQGMAHQMQVTLSLNDSQIGTLATRVRAYVGQKISVHTMMDARSQRFAAQLVRAFQLAGLTVSGNSTDVGPNYTGVMIAVHDPSPAPHPPLADGLSDAFQSMGIPISKVAASQVPEGEVAVFIGPD